MFSFLRKTPVLVLSGLGTVICGAFIIKDNMQGEKYKKKVKANNKVVLITGCNTGIGKETAKELAKRGATVYMACRNLKKCEKAREEIVVDSKNGDVFCYECDLASFESIRNFVKKFKVENQKLDILINNAGVMRCPQSKTRDGIEMQLGVNHMGHFLLTNLLLDNLKKANQGRIIVVASIAHERGKINVTDINQEQNYDRAEAYNQSKLANVLFTRELAKKLKGTNVTVNAVHPGIVNTDLIRHMSFYNSWLSKIFIKPFVWPFLKDATAGSQTILYLALDKSLNETTGLYFSDLKECEVADVAKDEHISKWLWKVSEKWTGVSY